MRLFRTIGRLIKPHVRWLFTKQWSLISNIVKALPVKYRVRFEMCMANEGRIESFREISVSELPCRTLIRSIFVQGLSPSRLEVSSLGLEESLSGLKESPLGLKESPMGLKESPTGLIESPSGKRKSVGTQKKSYRTRSKSCGTQRNSSATERKLLLA